MKKILIYILAATMALATISCSKEKPLNPKSVVIDSVNPETEFDSWLEENYRKPYNIQFFYRYTDIETDKTYDLVPAKEIYSRILAKMVKYLWIEPYAEISSVGFMRSNAPRVMQVIGCGAYNNNGTLLLGTAEGGQKITLYVGNWLEDFLEIHYNNLVDETDGYYIKPKDADKLNHYYLHTIHHEFAHILNQKITYPTEFKTISAGDYVAQWTSISDSEAAKLGFISRYASSASSEDFVECYSYYLSWTTEQLASWLDMACVYDETGKLISTEGRDKILRKLEIVKNYTNDVWKLDLDELRESIARRFAEIDKIEWSDFSVAKQ